MKRAYGESMYAKPYEKYCREHFPDRAEVMHVRLIRTQTEVLGGDCFDYWYVGDKSPVLEQYRDLEQI